MMLKIVIIVIYTKLFYLVPAAASFDSFNNFEERGKYFNFLLKKYKVKKIINDS